MTEPNDYITATRKNFVSNDNEGRMIEKSIVEIQGTFVVKIRNDAFNGNDRENAYEHINKFLEIVGLININGLTQDQFRLSIFPVSLAGAAYEWFTKECIGSITTWDNMLEKFILKFRHLSDHNEEETEEDDNLNEMDNLNDDKAKGPKNPWSENGVPYQLCDHICEPYRFKNGGTKWPTCTSDIDGSCNGGELPGMVRVGSMTYFQDHRWYDELADGKLKDETLALKAKIEGSWGDATPGVIKFYRWLKSCFENFHELKYEVLVKLQECWDYEASNTGCTQENQEHKGDPIPEPSSCKVRRFEMMKYSFDDDEKYITIKESEHLKYSKDSLDAYLELLRLIDDGWVVTTPYE
ncbi:hypothetical protein Tco_0994548 [Tanacetum coccineum]